MQSVFSLLTKNTQILHIQLHEDIISSNKSQTDSVDISVIAIEDNIDKWG